MDMKMNGNSNFEIMCIIADRAEMSVHPGDSVLVCCPSLREEQTQVCLDLLTPTAPEEINALSVLFTRSPDEYLAAWQQHVGTYPARNRIITVDADARSKPASTDAQESSSDREIERVTSPQNLTRLGVRVSDCLDEWTETASDRQVVICFESVSALLQYVDLDQAFKFLRVLTDRCQEIGAIGHYHMDRRAHDEQTIATLAELFDTVIEYQGGEWTTR
ncbi:DUF7504 family protein [Halosimplex pelagicum]|uniref:Recombinase RecA n=1 Tax=Halosimplex pelagicum TaxID=869886 RepID=A0A7D5TTF8_9EURY|nr:hypothetical protein [Halosimplex pelagicum]QLH81354.1 hypothetical protein HZS54_06825 [Halosimplex pelagicum]